MASKGFDEDGQIIYGEKPTEDDKLNLAKQLFFVWGISVPFMIALGAGVQALYDPCWPRSKWLCKQCPD
jgi:hypothetical protein